MFGRLDTERSPTPSSIVDRLRAAAWHFLISVLIALPAAALVFVVWYPNGLAPMLGGVELFFLVSGCDVVLGPLVSLVIFNRMKPRRELIRDYAVVAIVQLGALAYGLHVVSLSRPAYVAFAKDRFEVVTALELDPADLAEAPRESHQTLPWFGPKLVGVAMPVDPKDRSDALFQALAGKDVHLRPKYYDDIVKYRTEILANARPVDEIAQKHPEAAEKLANVSREHKGGPGNLAWLPVRHRFGFGIVLVDRTTAVPFMYLLVDPY